MSFPNFTFWSHLLTTVGLEVCCLAALGFVAQRFFRPADWQRAVWQMTVICLLLLPASEWTGFGRGTAGFLFGRKQMVEDAPAFGFTVFKSGVAGGPVAVKLNPPPPAARPAVWWPGWVWLTGTAIVLGRMASAQVLLLALRLRREKIASRSLRDRLEYAATCVGLRRKVSLLRMPHAISPMAFGILRPSIGLPPGFEARFSETEQEAVLAHELAHLAARDPMWFLLADFASALLWWHPLAWWVRRSLHGAAELAADEATALVPDGPGALAKCLVVLGKEMTAARGWGWIGINGGFRSKLGKRVERLTRMSGGAGRPLAGWLGAAAKTAAAILVVPAVVLLFGAFQSAHAQKEDSWRGELQESWNSSPGAMLLLAAADNKQTEQTSMDATNQVYTAAGSDIGAPIPEKQKQKLEIATRVQNAKLLYEMGRYDDAEAIFNQAMKDDPSDRAARYYLDLIKEARYMERARNLESGELFDWEKGWVPGPIWDTNLIYASKGRQRILSKLDSITFKEVSFDLPLKDVLVLLRTESQKRDPDDMGINFMINQNVDPSGLMAPTNIGTEVTIHISPPLKNLRLGDVLDAIVKGADQPIRYTVEDYAVVFSPKPPEASPLFTKTFRVNPNVFMQRLKNLYASTLNSGISAGGTGIELDDDTSLPSDSHDEFGGPVRTPIRLYSLTRTNSTMEAQKMVRAYFAAAGVDFTPPEMIFFNDRLGALLVRATASDLDLIQQAVQMFNQPLPQVTIEAKFAYVSQEDLRRTGFIRLGNTPTNTGAAGLPGGTAPSRQGPSVTANPSGIFPGRASVVPGRTTNIPSAVAVAFSALNGILSDAQSRTLINAIEQRTGTDILALPKVITQSGRQARIGVSVGGEGPTLDVIPTVGPDGFSIQTTAIASIKTGSQTWQISASHNVWDGQTLVISGAVTNDPAGTRMERMVFVTPRIVDPAGNLVHSDAELSKRPGIPPQ